jgi:4-amino-4-deoxy-L-arabinose transferase-like glycosyltransferase
MMTTTISRLSRWAATGAVLLIVIAISLYPGGTRRDSRATGFSFSQNFLSDLGMTVTHGGESNRIGAGVFAASFGFLALSIVGCALAFLRFHSTAPRARSLAAAGAIGVLLVGAGLLGAAVSPADVSPTVHMRSAALASATAPLALLLFAAAAARDSRLPRRVSVAWVVLAIAVGAWFAMRWGPGVNTDLGLRIQATVQKAVAVAIVVGLVYQTYQAKAAGAGGEA